MLHKSFDNGDLKVTKEQEKYKGVRFDIFGFSTTLFEGTVFLGSKAERYGQNYYLRIFFPVNQC